MKAAIEFDARVSSGDKERVFEVALEFEVSGLADAQMTLPLAKELLVSVAIAITNPGEFEKLARQLVAAKAPLKKPSKPSLRLVRGEVGDGA